MSRDFLIQFDAAQSAAQAELALARLRVLPRGEALFGVIENRGDTVFVTLTYLYMCPESHGSGQIRIYRCNEFPLQWQLHSVAMDAVAAVDTMIFPAHGVWWLLSSFHPLGDTETYPELHIFSAPDPLSGEWTPHPQNPLVVDPEFARNAGLLRDGNKIYRVSQARSFDAYGAWATVSEIKALSLDTYQEDRVSQLKPSFNSRATGLHHLQSNDDFTVWDQKQWERVR